MRPGLRAMRSLPVLETRRSELEKCVFCPKLCRSACPVSNAEPRETITPWGKMSFAWMAAHGDVPLDDAHAAPAWACTGCYACRESCDHRNPVADVLLDARAELTRAGVAPSGSRRVLERFARHDVETRVASRQLASHPRVRSDAPHALLVGCGYVRAAQREARDAIDAATALSGEPVALVEGCCGLPLRMAGDKEGFARHAAVVARSLEGRTRVTVVDAGCAMTLRHRYAEAGVELEPGVELLVEQAARDLARMKHVPHEAGPVRWHDPCQLGRGLGIYDAPRAILARALGRAPDEFAPYARRERAACSGAGGLLPSTMPEVARDIATARVHAHLELSEGVADAPPGERGVPGRIVTACASSLLAMRKAASPSSVAVDDLVSWISRTLASR
jgi:Fe-S oxidoreductase